VSFRVEKIPEDICTVQYYRYYYGKEDTMGGTGGAEESIKHTEY
jgi:hypothetical protein